MIQRFPTERIGIFWDLIDDFPPDNAAPLSQMVYWPTPIETDTVYVWDGGNVSGN